MIPTPRFLILAALALPLTACQQASRCAKDDCASPRVDPEKSRAVVWSYLDNPDGADAGKGHGIIGRLDDSQKLLFSRQARNGSVSDEGGSCVAKSATVGWCDPKSRFQYEKDFYEVKVGEEFTAKLRCFCGKVDRYEASTDLPKDLRLDEKQGTISGKPAEVAAGRIFTILAFQNGRTAPVASGVIAIKVIPAGSSPAMPPEPIVGQGGSTGAADAPIARQVSVTYPRDVVDGVVGQPIIGHMPEIRGGNVGRFVRPDGFPKGLQIDEHGIIFGTPTEVVDGTVFRIVAQDAVGRTVAEAPIAVRIVAH